MYFDQSEWEVRCEWGAQGVAALAPVCDAIVVVDLLSFSTCVDIAAARGALVYPYRFRDDSAARYAAELGATLARHGREAGAGYSLSPASLRAIPAGTRLVLPSPNGATLTLATGATPTLAGCLRNARAVALAAARFGPRIGVIAAGERWPDGGLRPAVEDWLGAGAVIAHLPGARSPEAELAHQAFASARADLGPILRACGSGKELIGRGFAEDVALAADHDRSDCAPLLIDGAYQRIKG
ncbi:MAG TPA: 2-phosphosulfolactate phosphatase [Herpetosiphonaceae bacterium]|nr:2-phosphosulfolactate phosphatase [Herpetosiphonaceae bacterium]